MKKSMYILLIFVFTVTGCSVQKNSANSALPSQIRSEADLLDFYRGYSVFTDPGEYAYLYENLPDSLPELSRLIKSQTIHPVAELPQYLEQMPEDRRNDESFKYPTVKSVLEGLIHYDSSGITEDRKPEDRLILGCRHNAILLASVLKYHGIPARVRTGHATYLIPGFHASHTLCEVWNENDGRWMLVDPSTGMIDFGREQFDFSYEPWIQFQQKEIEPDLYGFPGVYTGLISIVGKIPADVAAVLGTEYPISQYAPILDLDFENSQLTVEHVELLDTISELMKSLDAENFLKL